MQQKSIDDKRVFLVCSADEETLKETAYAIPAMVKQAKVYTAHEGLDACFKMENDPPHVIVLDASLPKMSGIDVVNKMLRNKSVDRSAFIIRGPIPDEEYFVDEVVTGQVQFIDCATDDNVFHAAISKALNYVSFGEEKGYRVMFLADEDILFEEGQDGDSAYLLKTGRLEAVKGEDLVLGYVEAGEFVGEMSHFNSAPRSATIIAMGDCELIEIPFGALDSVLFTKPAWSKALIQTLSKRLKNTIQFHTKKEAN